MATVKQLVADLADGKVTLERVVANFASRRWPREPVLTKAQRYGAEDIPPPSLNSFDWVDLNPRLNDGQRKALRAAFDGVPTG